VLLGGEVVELVDMVGINEARRHLLHGQGLVLLCTVLAGPLEDKAGGARCCPFHGVDLQPEEVAADSPLAG